MLIFCAPSGNYAGYGVEGLDFPYYGTGATAAHPNEQLAQCNTCATENAVAPYASFIALDVAPQQSYANIQALRKLYPGVYGTATSTRSTPPPAPSDTGTWCSTSR